MKSMQPKIGDTLWGVWEHRYYNEKRLVELEYVVYPVNPPTTEVMGFPPLLWVAAF